MTVTIIGSVNSSKDQMEKAAEYASAVLGAKKVHVPIPGKCREFPMYQHRRMWLKYIDESDLVLLVPKEFSQKMGEERCCWRGEIGESTTYEIAYAKHVGKDILMWLG